MGTYRINKGDRVYIQQVVAPYDRMEGTVSSAFRGMARVTFDNGATALLSQSRLSLIK